jgi:cytochrome c-type biogenesis protein CcmH
LKAALPVAVLLAALATMAAAQGSTEDPSRVVGSPRGPRLEGSDLDARAHDVAGLLRCPVCQGLSVADSPSTMAQNMRAQVRDLLAAGYDQDQILAYFERSYGEFVRLKPPLRGVNWLVWLAPLVALLAGAAVIVWALRAPRPAAAAAGHAEPEPVGDLPGPDTLPADPALARHVLRVRERAYGWPGGVSPSAEAASASAHGGRAAATRA